MCMEDIRIGRKQIAKTNTGSVSNTGVTQIVPFNKDRVALKIFASSPTVIFVSLDPGVTVATGLGISTGGCFIDVNIRDHGDACKGPWYGSSTAGVNFGYLEVILQDQ